MPVRELAGRSARGGDDVLDRAPRRLRPYREREDVLETLAHVFERIDAVLQVPHEVQRARDRRRGAGAEGVAVRAGGRELPEADSAGGAVARHDDELLAEQR